MLPSLTSIRDNLSEAKRAISKRDFSAKISIASQECQWLSLIKDKGDLEEKAFTSIYKDAE